MQANIRGVQRQTPDLEEKAQIQQQVGCLSASYTPQLTRIYRNMNWGVLLSTAEGTCAFQDGRPQRADKTLRTSEVNPKSLSVRNGDGPVTPLGFPIFQGLASGPFGPHWDSPGPHRPAWLFPLYKTETVHLCPARIPATRLLPRANTLWSLRC